MTKLAGASSSDPADALIKSVLAHVGTVRNPILVFSILACVLLNGFATLNMAETHQQADLTDNAMRIGGMLILFAGLALYFYAFLRLPSSSQELVFAEQALPEIARTKRVVHAAREGGA